MRGDHTGWAADTDAYEASGLEDTDRYRLDGLERWADRDEDTARLDIGGAGAEASADAEQPRAGSSLEGAGLGAVHPYAQGVIRYYRARTVLFAEQATMTGGVALRAWEYIRSVEPRHLPPVVRHAHLELTHLVLHELDLQRSIEEDVARFIAKVSAIAERIDQVVDDLLMEPR